MQAVRSTGVAGLGRMWERRKKRRQQGFLLVRPGGWRGPLAEAGDPGKRTSLEFQRDAS